MPVAIAADSDPDTRPLRPAGYDRLTSVTEGGKNPDNAPWPMRNRNSTSGERANAINPTIKLRPKSARSSIGLRPNRSPSAPQIGPMTAAAIGAAPTHSPAHSATLPSATPSVSRR